jgi:membrane protein DedA with SNARE-associated domain
VIYLASLIDVLAILFTSFALNLVPFAGPSNLLIASNVSLMSAVDPLGIGFLVAVGSATAKFIHYIVIFFLGKHIKEERRKRLDAVAPKLRRWGFIALFVAAATPIPDEPVIVPLGLSKYNPGKFFLAIFTGKLSITIAGAYFGKLGENMFSSILSQEALITISIVLTIAFTLILLKVDVIGLLEKALQRKQTRVPSP